MPCSWFSPQNVAQYLTFWVGNQHWMIHSVTKCLLNSEWSWSLSGRRKNSQPLLFLKYLWINTEGQGCLQSGVLYREVSERGPTSFHFFLIRGLTTLECGFIHTLWYFQIEKSRSFSRVKNFPVQSSWEALTFSFNGLLLCHKYRRLTFKHPLVTWPRKEAIFPTQELQIQSEGSGQWKKQGSK